MPNVYVEARPKGRAEGERIFDYVVEDHAGYTIYVATSQRDAILWARSWGHNPLLAPVRYLNDKKMADDWRSPE